MTDKMTDLEKIKVIQAKIGGEQIQFKSIIGDNKYEGISNADFNFAIYLYRVKPEPRYFVINKRATTVRYVGILADCYIHINEFLSDKTAFIAKEVLDD